jgi:hypothetical protein
MAELVNSSPNWDDIQRGILAEPLIAYGMTVRRAEVHEIAELAPLLPVGPRRTSLGPVELAERLVAEGTLYLVRDDVHAPMGLVRIRDGGEGCAEAGWRLADPRLGKGFGAILVEGVVERLFRAGAGSVRFNVPSGARGARRTLETLGFAPSDGDAKPIRYQADAAAFADRRRRGIGLLPTPAERRRGPSPGEQGLVAAEHEIRRIPIRAPDVAMQEGPDESDTPVPRM